MSNKPFIVAFTGVAQSGKDTAAKVLTSRGFQHVSFAEPMRKALYALNPIILVPYDFINKHQLEFLGDTRLHESFIGKSEHGAFYRLQTLVDVFGWDVAKQIPEVRALLQRFGTEAGRDVHGENVWIDLALKNLKPNDRWVITDCRFENEARAVLDNNGIIIKVVRDGVTAVNGHSSESGFPAELITEEISNDGSVADLHERVMGIVNFHIAKIF